MDQDQQLIRLMCEGDRDAFSALYQRHHRSIFIYALHMSGDRQAAEDVMQETFTSLMKSARSYDADRAPVLAFLLGIARNQLLRRLRHERRHLTLVDADVDSLAASERSSQLTIKNEIVETVRKSVLSLPTHYREVVVLCEFQEMSYEEAARVLNCPVGTVRSRLNRARKMLVEKLRAIHGEDESEAAPSSERCYA
jgi:RNA polymerase sigma-70 factor (ECF subfamily)